MNLHQYEVEALIQIADEGNPADCGWCSTFELSPASRSVLAKLHSEGAIEHDPINHRARFTPKGLCYAILEEQAVPRSIDIERLEKAALAVLANLP